MITYAPLEMQPYNYNSKQHIAKEYVLPKNENKNWSSFSLINGDSMVKLIENQTKRNIIHWLDIVFPIVENKYSEKNLENLLYEIITNLLSFNVSNVLFLETNESLLIKGLKNKKLFHLEVFPDEDFEVGYDAKINIINNRELLMHSSGTISELFAKF